VPLFLIFILIPIIFEIILLIQVGSQLGVITTLLLILVTAVIGINLMKQQGLKSWASIQTSLAQGKHPATEMASGVQLLFAGGLLLIPGFITDAIGFALLVPGVRSFIGRYLISSRHVMSQVNTNDHAHSHSDDSVSDDRFNKAKHYKKAESSHSGRIIDGEYEDKTQSH
jgi:UPF0716 protein FxsA